MNKKQERILKNDIKTIRRIYKKYSLKSNKVEDNFVKKNWKMASEHLQASVCWILNGYTFLERSKDEYENK